MGKGDGKTRKPKKKIVGPSLQQSSGAAAASSFASESATSPPPPRRVSNNINIPVRKQIMMAQINKQLQQSAASGSFHPRRKLERTSYRRTWEEEEMLEKAEERRRRGQEPDWEVILSRNATLPLVIVDGYNIIHKWSRLKKHMVKGDLARARQLLVDDLENLSSLKGWRIEVVFDGSHRRQALASSNNAGAALSIALGTTATTPRAERASTKEVSKHGVRVVYTGSGVEADSYIEARCAHAKNVTSGKLTSSFLVATDDQMVRMAGLNAGALCMGAERFVTELKAVRQSVAYRVEAAVAAANGHAIRPDALRKTPSAAAASAALLSRRFGRGSVVIEDKRKRKEEMKRRADAIPDLDIKIEVEVDEHGIPWWAKVPNHTSVYKA
jgi:predicted RNA-binding protein with PIN domain